MGVQIIKKTYQARGQFNGGEILENKPIGFPREGGELKPYSNLFYWAHAWSDHGSTIGLHPHQGFEIMSFVLKGSIEHYDTAHEVWKKLDTGAAQIIRSGNGISHSEKLNAGAHMFQVWFDPDLNQSLQQAASYDDYPHDVFPLEEKEGIRTKIYRGNGSPLEMDTPGVEIKELYLSEGERTLELKSESVYSIYVIEGNVQVEKESLLTDDFFIVSDLETCSLTVSKPSSLFMISSPKELNYRTYSEQYIS